MKKGEKMEARLHRIKRMMMRYVAVAEFSFPLE
jgi:hypothetical protein